MVIESFTEFEEFLALHIYDKLLVIPVLCDDTQHELNNALSFLFIKIIGKEDTYILPFDHNDCINLPIDFLRAFTDAKIYTFGKKSLLNIYDGIGFNNIIDVKLLYYMKNNAEPPTLQEHQTASHVHIKRLNQNVKNIHKVIPILKWQEELLPMAKQIELIISENEDALQEPAFQHVNEDKVWCLHNIEKTGVCVNPDAFSKWFPNSKKYIAGNMIHTQYNIYTTTGRPSNRFSNVNYAALNRTTGERESFVSRFGDQGVLFMFDFDAYHVRLIGEMVGFDIPANELGHEYLGKQYFAKDAITNDELKKSKELTFQMLYGGIHKDVANEIPYFSRVQQFIDHMYHDYRVNGYAETFLFKQKLYKKNFASMNPNKLFNFILQNFETERNIVVMKKVQKFLNNYQTKLVLYLYDAMLFDTFAGDGKQIIYDIKNLLEENGKYPVKSYMGPDFHNMERLAI